MEENSLIALRQLHITLVYPAVPPKQDFLRFRLLNFSRLDVPCTITIHRKYTCISSMFCLVYYPYDFPSYNWWVPPVLFCLKLGSYSFFLSCWYELCPFFNFVDLFISRGGQMTDTCLLQKTHIFFFFVDFIFIQ